MLDKNNTQQYVHESKNNNLTDGDDSRKSFQSSSGYMAPSFGDTNPEGKVMTTDEADDSFFLHEIEEESVRTEDSDTELSTSPCFVMSFELGATNLQKYYSCDSNTKKPNSIRRCCSQSILNTSSSYLDSNANKPNSIRRCASQSILKTSSSYLNLSDRNLDSNTTKLKPSTSFSTLEIREYPITLGDNPGGGKGPPISLDYTRNKKVTKVIELEDYEEMRPARRSRSEMHLPEKTRTWRLMRERGLSLKEIEKTTKAMESIRRQRKKSITSKNSRLSELKDKVGFLVNSAKHLK